jgi:N-acetyl sugar amidotransferase
MVEQCKRCLYTTDHPLGLILDDDGICSGCRIHEEKDRLNWVDRWRDLEKLVEPYRSKVGNYDCIVPVSGARDSYFILDIVVRRLKLRPLVVSYNKYFNTKVGIDNLANLRIKFNVDFHQKNVDPRVVKRITKKCLFEFGSVYWPILAGETVFPVQTAVMMGIPLIIWGAHQGLEQVGMYSHLQNVEMTRRYRKDHDLFNVEANDLVGPFDDLTEEDVINYRYPSFADIEAIGVRGIYLGNFVRWDPFAQHQEMVKNYGFKGLNLNRTFDKYDHADCYVYTSLHDMLKLFKHNYSKVTDQVCREIRHGRLSRDQGVKIVSKYELQEPEHMDLFCKWLGVERSSLQFVLNRHRNPKYWTEFEADRWIRSNTCVEEGGIPDLPIEYENVENFPSSKNAKYITIGRGVSWPDQPKIDSKRWI